MSILYLNRAENDGWYVRDHGDHPSLMGRSLASFTHTSELARWLEETYPDAVADAEPAVDGDGWIAWGGGECPVGFERVDLKLRSGETCTESVAPLCRWDHRDNPNDIMFYRVVSAND